MPPVRDLEYELLKRFQTELFRAMSRSKAAGQYQTEFQVYDSDQDEYLLDTVFQKLVAVLRKEKFFVACATGPTRLFIVSWDPILTRDSLTQAELNDPNSNASVRLRRYEWLKQREELKENEEATKRHYEAYQRIASRLDQNSSVSSPPALPSASRVNPLRQQAMHSPPFRPRETLWRRESIDAATDAGSSSGNKKGTNDEYDDYDNYNERGDHQIQVAEDVTTRSRLLRNLIGISTDDDNMLQSAAAHFDQDELL